MTAIVVVRFDQAVYVATDGLTYTLSGRTALASKVYTAPHMPLALAARGPLGVAHVVGTTLALMFPTFDDVVAGLEAEFPAIHKTYALSTGRPDLPDVEGAEFVLAGWSARRSQAEAHIIKAGVGRLTEIEAIFAAPWPQGFKPAGELTEATVEDTIIAMMEAQRAEHPHRIGSFLQVTMVTGSEIQQRVLRRWGLPGGP